MTSDMILEPASNSSGAESPMAGDGEYCGRCGRLTADGAHAGCAAAAELEPPRYCPTCARRLIVQVTPAGYTARCSAHGVVAATA